MVVRFDNKALKASKYDSHIGVDGDQPGRKSGISEADAIVSQARKTMGGPEQPVEAAAAAIMEEEETEHETEASSEPGPELNADALKAAQKNP
jgi:protein phosphatase PTC1